jgi:(p)ppGpp synthase/HD superfamily hydrolase
MKNYLNKLLTELKKDNSRKFDLVKIEKAYYFAEKAHKGQKRKS